MLGTQIKPVTVAKDLGVYIDCHLNFNEHITKTASDCMFKLTRVNKIKHLLVKKKNTDLSYKCFRLQQIILYCSTVWRSTSKKNVRKLQLVQNYASRIVAGLRKYDHVSEALKSFKWLNERDKLTQQRVTRQNKDLTLPWYRLATGQKTFSYRGAKLYNSIHWKF